MIDRTVEAVVIDPKIFDLALLDLQSGLLSGLPWLNHAFGKATRKKEIDPNGTKFSKNIVFPAVYIGGKDYRKCFPDQHLKNFSFFVIASKQNISHVGRKIQDYTADIGLIFWYDLRLIYPDDWQSRTNEHVKSEVVEVIKKIKRPGLTYTMDHFEDYGERIYAEFTDTEIDNQFLMRPFGGFRINGEIKVDDAYKCINQ